MTQAGHPDEAPQVLYRHTKRPAWGLAIIAWEKPGLRGYQFEDGQLRIFKDAFFHLLEEVDPPADVTERTLDQLWRALGRSEAKGRSGAIVVLPLDEQITYFREMYPEGFEDPKWLTNKRGQDAKKALKRHRNRVIADAREALAPEVLDELLAREAYAEVVQQLVGVLGKTDLVNTKKTAALRHDTGHNQRAIALNLRELIHGEGPLRPRFDAFIGLLDKPSWELATLPLALYFPETHICVRPSVLKQQALWLAPRLDPSTTPRGKSYDRYLAMAESLREKLIAAGLPPADMLDIADFAYATLRPTVRNKLVERWQEHQVAVRAAATAAANHV
ncbi:MAG: hypothetical protein KAI47_12120 [Deltaproteobacteria bacterium]|nr:hypothetical protein [Deltaproteobacteria bacterium]